VTPYLAAGSELLYHLGALYSLALDCNRDTPQAKNWAELAESLLQDVGTLHQTWSAFNPEKVEPAARAAIDKRLLGLNGRFKKIHPQLNLWILPARWPRILLRCEQQWQDFIARLQKHALLTAAGAAPALAGIAKRREILRALHTQLVAELVKTAGNYGIAKDL